jgi:hypothetical protein
MTLGSESLGACELGGATVTMALAVEDIVYRFDMSEALETGADQRQTHSSPSLS